MWTPGVAGRPESKRLSLDCVPNTSEYLSPSPEARKPYNDSPQSIPYHDQMVEPFG